MAKKQDNTEEVFEGVEQSLTRAEQFLETNRNQILYVVGAIIVVVLGIYSYNTYVVAPQETEAQEKVFMAQKYLEQDSLKLALNGDGIFNLGFLEIADEYSSTKIGNTANYYAGVCYLNLGEFENAIEYLDKFSGDDEVLSVLAKAGIGDAFLELGQNDDALDYYKKAMAMNNNKFVIPLVLMKAAIVSEMQEDYKSALKYYERIESDFGDSREAADVEKYIAKIEAKMAS
jgi:tetratricopeptide (TPR) repeat protein